ncbi:MAG: GNAT family N-acetyltransferase [Bacilli bacterium]|nr:GNAT family N-acetyltransferase [Bacilli bacterium]
MNIYLDRVKEENKDILFRLLEYSLFEESLNDGNEMNNEAIFEYKYFDKYFTDDDRDAFFIKELKTNKLLGFVMINTYMQKSSNGHSIAEFMVIPKYRRNKIGKQVAFKCFDMHRGIWEVSSSFGSDLAYHFWKKVIDEYTNCNNKFVDGIFIFNNIEK